MKPYVAIVTDSFREALSSRVLWLVLLGIVLFLAVLAPISLRDEVTTQIKRFDVTSGQRLISLLQSAATSPRQTAASRVVQSLEPALQTKLRESVQPGAEQVRTHEAIDALNGLLDNDDWFEADLWKSTTRLRELRELDEATDDSLTDQTRRRRARLRLEAALPGAFHPRSGDSVRLRYAVFDFPDAFVVTRSQFTEILNKIVLPLIVNLLLGVLGVFIAILVTGSIIPEMFQSGSLQLLLSKPISRSLLFLAKFIGGCAFVIVSIALMVVGLWLIVGFRLQMWNHNLLLCIPLFVFLFMVYYSVSAVAGLIWRNAIVSISVTVVFWMACFLVRVTHDMFEQFVAQPATITQLAQLNDDLFATTHKGEVLRYAADQSQWQVVLPAEFGNGTRALGPVALTDSNQILVAQIRRGRFNPFTGSNDTLQILTAAEQWKPIDGIDLPPGSRDIFVGTNNSLIAYGTRGISRAEGSKLEPSTVDQKATGMFAGLMSILNQETAGFRVVSPASLSLDTPMSVSGVPLSSSIVVYTRGRLMRLNARDDDMLSIASEVNLEGEPSQRAALAATANHVVIAREDSGIEIYDLETLDKLHSVDAIAVATPSQLQAAVDGSDLVAVVYSDGNALLIDTSRGKSLDVSIPGQGSIGCLAWQHSGELLIAYDLDHVITLDIATDKIVASRTPQRDVWRIVRDWVVRPLHTVFPKPGKLGETVQGIVIGESEIEAGPPSEVDLAFDRKLLEIWQPIVSCGIFIVVMLAGGCFYVSRQDF